MEAQLALRIVLLLLKEYADHISPADIGVIAPYNAQVRPVQQHAASRGDSGFFDMTSIVDAPRERLSQVVKEMLVV
eukprot:2342820-Pleurochrysis_carterae.AAC.3